MTAVQAVPSPPRPSRGLPASPSLLVLAAVLVTLAGCATSPPRDPDNACAIFEEKPDWWEAARESERRWGVPAPIQLAIVRQESSFRDDARPPHDTLLGIPMWWRVSSAYGYAQAKDETWDRYRESTGNAWADRDDFEDAIDFIGWYTDLSHRTLGIPRGDAYNHYLAYHEGHTGWRRKTYRGKTPLLQVARKVERQARAYAEQLETCRARLEARDGWWPL